MITVFADAPEENKESAETKTCGGDRRRLYFRAVRAEDTQERHWMRVPDKRHTVGRKLLPKTPRWQEKEIQRLCKDERRV